MKRVKPPPTRPRFALDLAMSPEEILTRVRARLADQPKVAGKVYRRTITLTLRQDDVRFWTPHLDVQLADAEGGGTRLSAMFAPAPHVWTTFVGFQALFAMLALSSLIYMFSAYTLDRDLQVPFVVFILAMIGGGLAYGTAYIGQGFGAEQMYELRSFLDHALEEPGETKAEPASPSETVA